MVELELEDARQEVARVGDVGRDVVLGPGVEVALGPLYRRANALVVV